MTSIAQGWQRGWALLFGLMSPVLAAGVVYCLVELWPVLTAQGTDSRVVTLIFGIEWHVTPDQAFLVAAALGGLLGGCLYTMGIYARRRGSASFAHSWSNWYWSRTIVGAGLGLAVYLLIDGGLFLLGGSDQAELPNAPGVVGISILVGLFTDRVMGRLRELAGNYFAADVETEPGREPGGQAPAITAVEPRSLIAGASGQQVALDVQSLFGDFELFADGKPISATVIRNRGDVRIELAVPDALVASAGSVNLTLQTNDHGQLVVELPIQTP